MKLFATITFVFFALLSVLIYVTKSYQYERYLIVKKSNKVKFYKVNLNLANWQDFDNLPGVGEALARDIIADRKENGRFDSIQEITRVKGIGPKKYEAMSKYLTLEVQ